jgi:hypothetical protein
MQTQVAIIDAGPAGLLLANCCTNMASTTSFWSARLATTSLAESGPGLSSKEQLNLSTRPASATVCSRRSVARRRLSAGCRAASTSAQPASRPRCYSGGESRGRKDAARARLHRRYGPHVCRLRQDHPCGARSILPQGNGSAGRSVSRRGRGIDLLRDYAERCGPGVAHYLIHLYDYPALADKGSMRPGAIPRSRRLRRMRSTCPRTSLLASVPGTSRSRPTLPPCKRPRRPRPPAIRCMGRTIWSKPICNSTRIRMRAQSSTTWSALAGAAGALTRNEHRAEASTNWARTNRFPRKSISPAIAAANP